MTTFVLSLTFSAPRAFAAPSECDPNSNSFPVPTGLVNYGDFTTPPADIPPDTGAGLGYDNTTAFYYPEANFWSHAANVGYDVYPIDTALARNQFSIQQGDFLLPGPVGLDQKVFPGDPMFNVPRPTNDTWYYSNGNGLNGVEYINWEQDVTGLTPGEEYVFVAYITNLIENPPNDAADPIITLKVGGNTGQVDGTTIWGPTALDEINTNNASPLNGWQRVAAAFTADATGSARLKIIDSAAEYNGDDFGFTSVSLQLCAPANGWKPISRSYGNDVVAGGGYYDGTSCVSEGVQTDAPFVRGLSRFNPTSPEDHSTYTGTGSDMAVFAKGDITGWLPGAMTTTARSSPWELSFANTVSTAPIEKDPTTYKFGGGFTNPLCPEYPVPVSPDIRNNATLNISSLNSGDYVVPNANVDLIAPTPIENGKRIRIFIDDSYDGDISTAGTARIRTNISYEFTSWNDVSRIPLLEIYPRGDLYIDEDVQEVTGVYMAKGDIRTCIANDAAGTVLIPNVIPTEHYEGVGHHMTYIADNCQDKLTVYGSMTAEKIHMYRTTKDGLSDGDVAEVRSSSNLSEAFVFSPEIYLARLSSASSGPDEVTTVDSVVSLPPIY